MALDYYNTLTDEEKDEVTSYSMKIRWGFTPESIREQFKIWKEGDLKAKAKVCYLLEDCNYHTLCRHLSEDNEAAALRWMDDEMPLEEKADDGEPNGKSDPSAKVSLVTMLKNNAAGLFNDIATEFREMARCIENTDVEDYGKRSGEHLAPEYGELRKKVHKQMCEMVARYCSEEASKVEETNSKGK